jgi:hypothetical protein
MLAPETVLIRAFEISLVCLQCARAQNHTRTFTHARTHTFIHARTHTHIHIYPRTNHMQMKKGKIYDLERQKNIFSIWMFVFFFGLAWFASWVVIFSSRYHHSLLFNPWGDQYSDNVWSTWICFLLHFLVCAVFLFSQAFTQVADKVTKSEAYKSAFIFSRKEDGVLSGLLQAAVPASAVDDEFEKFEDESYHVDPQPTPPPPVRENKSFFPGPETTPVCVGVTLRVLWRLLTERHAYRRAPVVLVASV